MVTTKSGSGKASKKGLEITYSGTYGTETIGNIPNYQNSYGTGTNFAYAQANGSWGAPFVGARNYATLTEIPHWLANSPGLEQFAGTTVPYQAYPNNVKDFFQNGSLFENSVSITGGSETSVFTATLSSLNQQGFVPNSQFKRHNISIGGKTNLSNGLYIGGNVAVTKSLQDGPITGVGNLGGNNPSIFARTLLMGRNWDILGTPYQNPVDKGSEFFVGRGTANNPFWSAENTGISGNIDRYVLSVNAGYDINDWLNVTYRLGMNTYNQLQKEFQRPNGTGSVVGTFTQLTVGQTEINSDLIVTINRDLTEDISLRAIVGNNINQRTQEAQQINGTGYVIFDIDDLDNMNAISPAGGSYSRKRIMGAYTDLNFGYKNYAFLTFTGRNDWSSTLPKGGNSFFYPAITGSFVLSDALELPTNVISSLKIRGGWSRVGNDTDPYLLNNVFLVNSSLADDLDNTTAQKPFRGVSGATLTDVGKDPNLKPEITQEIEFGTDVSLIDNKISLALTYYKRNTTDQIAQVSVPEETGFASLLTNFGEVSNEGIEIGLDVTPVRLQNGFTWNVYGTFTHNKNKIVELVDGIDEIQFGSGFAGSVGVVHQAGKEFGLLQGSVNARDDEGNLLIDPTNGQYIRALEPKIIGNPNPDFILGLTNSFSFKGVSFRAVFDWRQGGDLYSDAVGSMLGRGVLAHQADREFSRILKGVYGDVNTLEPIRNEAGEKIVNQTILEVNDLYFGETFAANGADEWQVWDATTYRLREVSISYSLPSALLESTPFGNVSFGLTGRNLWYLAPNMAPDSNFDPEGGQFGSRNVQGISYSSTPSVKRFTFNLKVTF